MRIHLIRHTTPDVPLGTCYGWADVPLASTFAEEAALVQAKLATLLQGAHPELVYSSPLSRCRRLAELCGYSNPLLDERLKELNFGAWELQPFEAISDPQLQRWYDDYLYEAPTGGESFYQQSLRVASFLDELCEQAKNEESPAGEVLIFTHGGVLLGAGLWAGLFPLEEAFDHRQPYGAILTLTL